MKLQYVDIVWVVGRWSKNRDHKKALGGLTFQLRPVSCFSLAHLGARDLQTLYRGGTFIESSSDFIGNKDRNLALNPKSTKSWLFDVFFDLKSQPNMGPTDRPTHRMTFLYAPVAIPRQLLSDSLGGNAKTLALGSVLLVAGMAQ